MEPAEDQGDHFRTDHLRGDIKSRTVSGGIISGTSQGSQLVLTVVYNAILARLLTPLDFGLVAMVTSIAAFLQVFRDAGLSTATIQRVDITQAQVSNLFWVNVAVSGTATLIMIISAPLLARFFHQDQLVGIAVAMSASFLLEGLSVQHFALLGRQMRFNVIAAVEVGGLVTGFAVGIVLALLGWGYWSLVGATLTTASIRLASIWLLTPWRPSLPARHSGTRPLVRFGVDLTLVGIITAFSRGADNLLIGRYIGADAVGLYSRATALLARPMERLIAPIYSVMVPALSRLQGEPDRYRRAFLQVFEALAIGGFLFSGLFFPLARAAVLVVLGPRWHAAAPIFAAFTTAALYLPLATATSWLYTSQGRGRDLLVAAFLAGAAMVGSFVIGLPYGPIGVAIAYAVCGSVVILPSTFYIAGRRGPVSASDLWISCLKHVPVLLFVLAATRLASAWVAGSSPLVELLICVPIGLLTGAIAVWAFPATRAAVLQIVVSLDVTRGVAVIRPGWTRNDE